MKKLYIIFDQIPSPESGGLVNTYINLTKLLKDKYKIEIISIFNPNEKSKKQFSDFKIHIIKNTKIDINFIHLFNYLKKGQLKKFVFSIYSMFYYFFSILSCKVKLKKYIEKDAKIIVSCPSAAIFMPKIPFILEIHIDYRYFFGKNILGRIQSYLMTKPTMTIFRTKNDAKNAPKSLNPYYIYNFFDNSKSKKSNTLVKNKILYVGRLEKQKNPIKLLEFAKELSKINKNFILDIYGSGSMLDEVLHKIEQLELQNIVFYKGFTNDKNIYNQYSLLWLTSDFEGFGLVIIEAKACGIPTISTDWGKSAYEVIIDKEDGFITNDNKLFIQKTNEILNNENLQIKLSNNAYKNFNKFSKENALKEWLYILENYNKKR